MQGADPFSPQSLLPELVKATALIRGDVAEVTQDYQFRAIGSRIVFEIDGFYGSST
jgi:hypothetical protein